MHYRNAVFIITEEKRCPLYNVGEELRVHEGILTLPTAKPTCLVLTTDLADIICENVAFEQIKRGEVQKSKFECGGCSGIIRFEFKKEKEFATLQMKLLDAAQKRERMKPIEGYLGALREIETFRPLSDDDLLDFTELLEFNEFNEGFLILQKGDPGTHLFILLSGRVEVVDQDGAVVAEIGAGEVFGEVSLLSGNRVNSTVIAAEQSEVAMLNRKNFQHIITRFPVLQIFFYKLQARRIAEINLKRAAELASDMAGYISDFPPAELSQMLNGNMKSGRLEFELKDNSGWIVFNEGEVVDARWAGKSGTEAFYEIMTLKQGRFQFVQELTQEDKEKDVIGGFMGMLMEGMKRLDDLAAEE